MSKLLEELGCKTCAHGPTPCCLTCSIHGDCEFENEKEKPMDENTFTIIPTENMYGIGTSCLVCGELVTISHINDVPKICDKCKQAIMKMREEMEK